ncbi:hypothetical protein WKW79_32130 [Variovorax robiniae]|uniref:Uncharacterized protein n=1 Tax=Variovorax robiniae TaxID=1836199 RepID=A0ABU8XI29_9BURK
MRNLNEDGIARALVATFANTRDMRKLTPLKADRSTKWHRLSSERNQ